MNELNLELTDVSAQVFCGEDENNIKYIKTLFPKLKIVARGSKLIAFGEEHLLKDFQKQMEKLIAYCAKYNRLDERTIDSILSATNSEKSEKVREEDIIVHGVNGKIIRPQTPNQVKLVELMHQNDMVFAVGPAGTGKTYLAVAAAVDAMEKHQIERIVLVRPAVEAGEKLGFLPGDLAQKVDPYLRPLYDALYDLMGFDRVTKLMEKGLIEIAPLAYMRGRTLNGAYVILDEAQNTTPEQMKMFLTRIGFGAKAVITGDISQIDLPRNIKSGLKDAREKLRDVEGLYFHTFTSEDVVRHPLVQKIVEAYEAAEEQAEKKNGE